MLRSWDCIIKILKFKRNFCQTSTLSDRIEWDYSRSPPPFERPDNNFNGDFEFVLFVYELYEFREESTPCSWKSSWDEGTCSCRLSLSRYLLYIHRKAIRDPALLLAVVSLGQSSMYRKSDLCIPTNKTAWPRSQLLLTCICERFIYSQDLSA